MNYSWCIPQKKKTNLLFKFCLIAFPLMGPVLCGLGIDLLKGLPSSKAFC